MKDGWKASFTVMMALVLGTASPAFAQAYWDRIIVDDYYSGKITAYECSGLYRDPSGNCLGAGNNVVYVGVVAVYYMDPDHNDPIARFGTKVVVPTALNLWTEGGTRLNTDTFYVRDTGYAPAGFGRGWVDIYCGDAAKMSRSRINENISTVTGTYLDTKFYGDWFDV